jgi:hypothetical protein
MAGAAQSKIRYILEIKFLPIKIPKLSHQGGYIDGVPLQEHRTVFIYGFAKSERDNIDPDELEYWQRIATAFLRIDDAKLKLMIEQQELKEVSRDEENKIS